MKNFLIKNLSNKILPKRKKILITGSNGFIGRYIVEAICKVFKKNSNIVYGIDINNNNFSYNNYKYFKKDLFNLKKQDIPNVNFDYIIHLAGIPSPVYYKKYPLRTIYLNAELSRELLEISEKQKVNSYILAQVKYMVIQVKKALYLQKKILMEMFPLLVIDRVMMKVKEWGKHFHTYIRIISI